MDSIKNLTPHPINMIDEAGRCYRTFEPTGLVRLKSETVSDADIDGVPTSRTIFGRPEGLPEEKTGTFYIVSQLVKSACSRADLLVPAEVVRDEQGRIVGCRSLGR